MEEVERNRRRKRSHRLLGTLEQRNDLWSTFDRRSGRTKLGWKDVQKEAFKYLENFANFILTFKTLL